MKNRDIGFDFDFDVKKVTEFDDKLNNALNVIECVIKRLKDFHILIKASGTGIHILIPIDARSNLSLYDITPKELVFRIQTIGRYLIEEALLDYNLEWTQNKKYIVSRWGEWLCEIEVHPDIPRLLTVPFSMYPKEYKLKDTEYEGKNLICLPLKDMREVKQLTIDDLILEDLSHIPKIDYPKQNPFPTELYKHASVYFDGNPNTTTKAYHATKLAVRSLMSRFNDKAESTSNQPMFTNAQIDAIKAKNRLKSIIGTEKDHGKEMVLCPFPHKEHGKDTVKSLSVNHDRQVWHCFGCERGGTVIHFVMERDKIKFNEALKRLGGN